MRELGINASHVGHEGDGAPPRGSGDDVVLAHAKRTNQVVVTSNHDMILLCAEQDESVIWIDPRGRQFKRTELVPLVFLRVEEWHEILRKSPDSNCVHVLRTKTEVLTLNGRAISSSNGCDGSRLANALGHEGRLPVRHSTKHDPLFNLSR